MRFGRVTARLPGRMATRVAVLTRWAAPTIPTVEADESTPRVRLALVRHGESNVTVERVIGGFRTCSGLSELGRRQSERLAARVSETCELEADVLIASDFPRAIETAEIIRPALGPVVAGAEIEQIGGFGEHDPGPEIDGMTFDAYVERFGTPDWSGDPHVEIFPGGETTFEFHRRVVQALDDLFVAHRGKFVVVACHGGVVDAVFRHLLRLDVTGGFVLQSLNTAITEFLAPTTPDGTWRLVRYNDSGHLVGLPASTERHRETGTDPE